MRTLPPNGALGQHTPTIPAQPADVEFLRYIMRDAMGNIARRLQVGIGVFDSTGSPIPDLDRIGFQPFCEKVRETRDGIAACRASDLKKMKTARQHYQKLDRWADVAEVGGKQGRRAAESFMKFAREHFTCPFGFIDLCYPLVSATRIWGFIFIGQLRCENISVATCDLLQRRYMSTFSKGRRPTKRLFSRYLTSYFDTPRRVDHHDDLLHYYRLLRDYARLFSDLIESRRMAKDAVQIANDMAPIGNLSWTLNAFFRGAPFSEDGRVEIWFQDREQAARIMRASFSSSGNDMFLFRANGRDAEADPSARELALSRHVVSTIKGLPDRVYSSDGQELREHIPSRISRGAAVPSLLASSLRTSRGQMLGSVLVYSAPDSTSGDLQRLSLWLDATRGVLSSILWRERRYAFLRSLHNAPDLSALAVQVQEGIAQILDLGENGACTLFWVDEKRRPDWGSEVARLVPALPVSVKPGFGPAAKPTEIWYRLGQGFTGWTWAHGRDLDLCAKALNLGGAPRGRNLERFREYLCDGRPGWPKWYSKAPQWAGKVGPKGERKVKEPRPTTLVPIIDIDRVCGVLRVTRSKREGCLDDAGVDLLFAVARHLAAAKKMSVAIRHADELSSAQKYVHNCVDQVRYLVQRGHELASANTEFPVDVLQWIESVSAVFDPVDTWMTAVRAVGYVVSGDYLTEQHRKLDGILKNRRREMKMQNRLAEYRRIRLAAKDIQAQLTGVRLKPTTVHVCVPVDAVVRAFRKEIAHSNFVVRLSVRTIPASTRARIVCDQPSLSWLLTELLKNARKHAVDTCGDMRVCQSIQLEVKCNSHGWIDVSVHDQAPDFALGLRDQVHSLPLAPHSVRLYTQGTGLAMCSVLAILHGGYLIIEKSSKRTFTNAVTLRLPASTRRKSYEEKRDSSR